MWVIFLLETHADSNLSDVCQGSTLISQLSDPQTVTVVVAQLSNFTYTGELHASTDTEINETPSSNSIWVVVVVADTIWLERAWNGASVMFCKDIAIKIIN